MGRAIAIPETMSFEKFYIVLLRQVPAVLPPPNLGVGMRTNTRMALRFIAGSEDLVNLLNCRLRTRVRDRHCTRGAR
jgi:hypothetical protein